MYIHAYIRSQNGLNFIETRLKHKRRQFNKTHSISPLFFTCTLQYHRYSVGTLSCTRPDQHLSGSMCSVPEHSADMIGVYCALMSNIHPRQIFQMRLLKQHRPLGRNQNSEAILINLSSDISMQSCLSQSRPKQFTRSKV